jgi:TonB family protein
MKLPTVLASSLGRGRSGQRWSLVAVTLFFSVRAFAEKGAEAMPRQDGSEEVPRTPSATVDPPAKSASTPPSPVIVMPKSLSTPAKYPEQGTVAARVLLEITVDKEGRASNPKLLDGAEPFATAAVAAIGDWRFSPATRDGVPVDARIRFVVRFTPPNLELPPPGRAVPTLPTPKPSQKGTKGKQTKEIEVTIQGERPEAAVVSMGRSDVEQMPGAFGDPFRAIDVLPGITPIVSGLPFFFIRGAPPGNQGYFFDGIRVPLLYHVAAGPSVVNPALVDRVDLYAGGYPARYGRFAGAIIAGESRDPTPQYHAQGSVRLVDSGGYVTAPVGRGVVALGGRYSYTGAIVSLIVPQVKIEYWDYQAKVVQYLSDRDTVSLFALVRSIWSKTRPTTPPKDLLVPNSIGWTCATNASSTGPRVCEPRSRSVWTEPSPLGP